MTLVEFIRERHAIYTRRASGAGWPWTRDSILQQYRFCNVYRQLDAQTKLIQEGWLQGRTYEDIWFVAAVARFPNYWPSVSELRYPLPSFSPSDFKRVMHGRGLHGLKYFSSAYLVHSGERGSKIDYVADKVLLPMYMAREALRPRAGDTLQDFAARLTTLRSVGGFMAGQIIADTKFFCPVLKQAQDWWTWAVSGPGSRKGMNRVHGRPLLQPWKEGDWLTKLQALQVQVSKALPDLPRISAQDLQNCLCEYDKYQRVLLGEGKPRSGYKPPVTLKELHDSDNTGA